ncbi:hypothetical protein [Clostridium beijerinckii]|uniref:hypothetical protein n=1 Tax=Clostridium beijerinckii TaxID=1520 RepID=UPI001F4C408A|nr:hypothetical protein [Clostridium beijerinckii]NRW84935.1 hypothetical protein [Clostridium beijerinckii]
MIFICTLILVTILSLLLTSSIKKNYYLYYSLATGIAIITSFYEILRITSNAKLEGVILTLEKTSIRGLISVSFLY